MCFFLQNVWFFFPKKICFWFFPKTLKVQPEAAVDGVCDDSDERTSQADSKQHVEVRRAAPAEKGDATPASPAEKEDATPYCFQ